MAASYPDTITQQKDAQNHGAYKLEQMNKISNLTEGHMYALQYFPAELQALLSTTTVKLDERAPGYFGAVLAWSKESRQGNHQALPLPSRPLEILWDIQNQKTVLCDRCPSSATEEQTVTIDSEKGLSRLQGAWAVVWPYSGILSVVDGKHLTFLDVLFRYCVLVQGYDDAVGGCGYSFWVWFEELCHHVAEQALAADVPPSGSTVTVTKSERCDNVGVKEARVGEGGGEVDTGEQAHRDESRAFQAKKEEAQPKGECIDEELAKAHREADKWKKAYEAQSKMGQKDRILFHTRQQACLKAEAKLKQRDRELQEWKKKYEALRNA
jgi:hypothetical protein